MARQTKLTDSIDSNTYEYTGEGEPDTPQDAEISAVDTATVKESTALEQAAETGVQDAGLRVRPMPPGGFQRVPDNFAGGAADGSSDVLQEPAAAPEPDAEGYVRPAHIGPAFEAPVRPLGQTVEQGRVLREPQPIRPFNSAELDTQVLNEPGGVGGFAPLQQPFRCLSCGSTVGVFHKDPFTGSVRHQGCTPNYRAMGGAQGAPRTTPQVQESPSVPRQFRADEAKKGLPPLDETV